MTTSDTPEYLLRALYNWPDELLPRIPAEHRDLLLSKAAELIATEAKRGWDLVTTYNVSAAADLRGDAMKLEHVVFVFRKRNQSA